MIASVQYNDLRGTIDLNEAFSLFKRFEIVMGTDVDDIVVDDDDSIDLV